MKGIALIALLGVGAFAIWKHHIHAATAAKTVTADSPSGVSQYPATPAAQYPGQVLAALPTNSDAVSDPGFAAAFGDYENQPGDGESLY